jgi:hypothetical protein
MRVRVGRSNLTAEQKALIKSGGGPMLAPEYREAASWHVQKHLLDTKRAFKRANSNVEERRVAMALSS